MNAKLAILQRQMDRRAPEPVPESHGLGAAIESLIADEVARRVGEAVDRQPPARVRELFKAPDPVTDFKQIPPVPKAPTRTMGEIQFGRDELGRIAQVSLGAMQFYVQRNELGQVMRMVPADIAPMPPCLPPSGVEP